MREESKKKLVSHTILLLVILINTGCVGQEEEVPKTETGITTKEEIKTTSPRIETQLISELKITSPAFEANGEIPTKYTCDGADINPPLHIEGIPEEIQSLVLIVDDPDAPGGTWDHWIVWNIPPVDAIEEDSIPGTEGLNDFRRQAYGGPCPPSGTHRYFFKVYALDTMLDLPPTATKTDVEQAMEGHILAQGELIGKYSRS